MNYNFSIKIFILIVTIGYHKSFAQTRIKNYISEKATPIVNIDPDSVNYSDLEFIGNAIGNSKIVMLGEQDHGDAPTFIAKTKIIKYLHEQKGFNVIAFESDFFGLNFGWDHLPKNEINISNFLKENIFPIWTYCDACNYLFHNYIPKTYKTNSPLYISGFDNQLILNYTTNYLSFKLDSVLTNLGFHSDLFRIQECLDDLKNLSFYNKKNKRKNDPNSLLDKLLSDTSSFTKREKYLTQIKKQLSDNLTINNFWVLTVENLIQFNKELKLNIEFINGNNSAYWLSNNIRDKQMALNLKWLTEIKYPKEKIIVWAHNYHISKYGNYIPKWYLKKEHSMGRYFTEDSLLTKMTYVIGFASLQGSAGRILSQEYKLPRYKLNSMENWIDKSYQFSFIDFFEYNITSGNKIESFYMSGSLNSSHEVRKAQWSIIFDGVFFIRDMYPCELLNAP